MLILNDVRGLPVETDSDIMIEIGRIEYIGNIAKIYIPKRFREALKLNKAKDREYLMIKGKDSSITLIRDDDMIDNLKPKVYAARKAYEELKKEQIKA